MQTTGFDNRRQHPRAPLGCEVQLQPINSQLAGTAGCSYDSVSCDISAGGMRIWSDRPYPTKTRLLLAFECDAQGWSGVTSCVGSVVWIDPHPAEGRCLLGIKFGDAEDVDKETA
ncbi:PilZ domain-containing protein [Thiocystis violascens]|uniref:PilZ domain-containing protein n=1 Tax=Thiocystis violascens (strain ATCC 17096 / DSM 198 / 6111) TaxID=765911 RepID=I3Y6B4_THIV6|nr:PilZ domain-containing protein [Thiocystis violascens]AFL72532.1 PilZ domain-containing protein [Thiocystis violascens DSM 198]